MQAEFGDDFLNPVLVGSIGHHHHLQVPLPVVRNDAVENIRQQLGAFLKWIEPRRPEEDRSVRILLELEFALQGQLVGGLALPHVLHREGSRQ